MDNNDIYAPKAQGLWLAPASLSSEAKEIWAKGYAHGRILGEAVGAAHSVEEVAKELLKRGLSIDEISKLTGCFEEHVESLQREEEMKQDKGES